MVKTVIGFIFIVSVVGTIGAEMSKADVDSFKKYLDACTVETGFDTEKFDWGRFPDSKAAKCFSKCMSMKMGLINDKAEPQYEKINQVFDIPAGFDGQAELKKCYEENKSKPDLCERVADTEICVALAIDKFQKKA